MGQKFCKVVVSYVHLHSSAAVVHLLHFASGDDIDVVDLSRQGLDLLLFLHHKCKKMVVYLGGRAVIESSLYYYKKYPLQVFYNQQLPQAEVARGLQAQRIDSPICWRDGDGAAVGSVLWETASQTMAERALRPSIIVMAERMGERRVHRRLRTIISAVCGRIIVPAG